MSHLALAPEIVDAKLRRNALERLRVLNVALPTLSQLADPDLIPARRRAALAGIDPEDAHPANLWRVHWFNDEARTGRVDVPGYLVLPEPLTGVNPSGHPPTSNAPSIARLAKLVASCELASLTAYIVCTMNDFSREGMWGFARGDWRCSTSRS